jgi:hypothetical protein
MDGPSRGSWRRTTTSVGYGSVVRGHLKSTARPRSRHRQFWTSDDLYGGVAPSAAAWALRKLGFFIDDGPIYELTQLRVDRTHGKPAPYQYVVLLWAIQRARSGTSRLVPFHDVSTDVRGSTNSDSETLRGYLSLTGTNAYPNYAGGRGNHRAGARQGVDRAEAVFYWKACPTG